MFLAGSENMIKASVKAIQVKSGVAPSSAELKPVLCLDLWLETSSNTGSGAD